MAGRTKQIWTGSSWTARPSKRVDVQVLGLPRVIRQEDGTRDAFERMFQAMDSDSSKTIDEAEFCRVVISRLGGLMGASGRRGEDPSASGASGVTNLAELTAEGERMGSAGAGRSCLSGGLPPGQSFRGGAQNSVPASSLVCVETPV